MMNLDVALTDKANVKTGRIELWDAVDEVDGGSRVRVVSQTDTATSSGNTNMIKEFEDPADAKAFYDDIVQEFGKADPPESAAVEQPELDLPADEVLIDTPKPDVGGGSAGGPPAPPPPKGFGDSGRMPFDENDMEALLERLIASIKSSKITSSIKKAKQKRERGIRLAKSHKAAMRGDIQGIRAAQVGELISEEEIMLLDNVGGKFTEADGELLVQKIHQHYMNNLELVRKHIDKGALFDVYKQLQTENALYKLLGTGQIPTRLELELLQNVYGEKFIKSILEKFQSKLGVSAELLLEAWNMPRALLATADISASGRQALPFLWKDGGRIYKEAFALQARALINEEVALAAELAIKADPDYTLSQSVLTKKRNGEWKTHKLDMPNLSPTSIQSLSARAEPFIGARLIETAWVMEIGGKKINVNPLNRVVGPITRASERAYITMLNKVRFGTFKYEIGKLPTDLEATNPERYAMEVGQIIDNINILSGRGTVGLGDIGVVLNGIFFAPRFAISRIQMPLTLLVGTGRSRRTAIATLGSWIGTVGGLMLLMEAAGIGEIEKDSNSSDFMKFKIGHTRIDPWGGLQPVVVMMSRLMSQETKSITTKDTHDIRARDAMANFLFNKLNPSTRFVVNQGESFGGEGPLSDSPIPMVPRAAFDNLVPLWIQDTMEVTESYGLVAGTGAAALSIFGFGVQTFNSVYVTTQSDFATSDYATKYDLNLGRVGPSLRMDGENVALTDDQRARLQQRSFDLVNEELDKEAGKDFFKNLPTFERQSEEMHDAVDRGRDNAREEMRDELKGQTPSTQRTAPATRRATPTPTQLIEDPISGTTETPEIPATAPEVPAEGTTDPGAAGTEEKEVAPDYQALYTKSQAELAKSDQRANSAEGRLKNVVTRDDLAPISAEIRRLRLSNELQDEDPDERKTKLDAFDNEQEQTQTQAQLNARGNRIQASIARKMTAAGIEAGDPRLKQALETWAKGVTDGQVTDIDPLMDALEAVDQLADEQQVTVSTKAIEAARVAALEEAQGKNITDGVLDLGVGGAGGGGTSIQELVNRFGRGEDMPMEQMVKVNEAMGQGMLPKLS